MKVGLLSYAAIELGMRNICTTRYRHPHSRDLFSRKRMHEFTNHLLSVHLPLRFPCIFTSLIGDGGAEMQ